MIQSETDEQNPNPLNDHLSSSTTEFDHVALNHLQNSAIQTMDVDNEKIVEDLKEDIQHETIPTTVRYLGMTMFLMNCAFVMVYSFSGLYMRSLGMPNVGIGFVEGIADALSFIMKFVSGALSDALGRRKPIMYVGYALSVIARPIMAGAMTFLPFFSAKMIERVGNGILGTPRDAIVADITPPKRIGAAYGLKRSLATLGSITGAIVGYIAMYLTNDDMRAVFGYACIPPFLAFFLLIFFVKEPKRIKHSAVSAELPLPATKKRHPFSVANIRLLGPTFWLLMIINFIFMLSRMGEQFIVLHATTNYGFITRNAPIIMIIFNGGWCLTSYPVGLLSERINRYWLLIIGIIIMILAGIILANAANIWILMIGVLFWGFQYGITMNIFTSLIADTVPENMRGTGFGFYYIISAIAILCAETMAGKIADVFGYQAAYITSCTIALFSLILLVTILAARSSPRKIM